ncbi:ribonuclease P protein component [Maridesulfovibrio ferrireducens]|uniref:Ribonuclease P protein component n=1 Tax=Maridesulfovibrio ferrireducens TaxID=246191 RepID=A0A1G9FHH6_9BACT|nr:ribonuclease P protein component [Maridesulfovibrio ferrireducens]
MICLNWTKEHRLLRKPDFDHCYEQGKKHYTKSFILFVLCHGSGPGGVRLGLTVSRKAGPAVVRNRIKRVMREFFRLYQNQFQFRADIIFVPKRALDGKKITLGLVEKELIPIIGRLNKLVVSPDQE